MPERSFSVVLVVVVAAVTSLFALTGRANEPAGTVSAPESFSVGLEEGVDVPVLEPASLAPSTSSAVSPTTTPPTSTVAPSPTVTVRPSVPAATPSAPPPPTPAATVPATTTPPTTTPAPSNGDPGTGDRLARVRAAFDRNVPGHWRDAITPRFEIIDGSTSWAHSDGTIQISKYHADADWTTVVATVTHEFGHLIAFEYGTGAYAGAPPAGWPYNGERPEEMWADCVTEAFTGIVAPSHGLPGCPADTRTWTANWLATNP